MFLADLNLYIVNKNKVNMILLQNIVQNDLKFADDISECLIHNISNHQIEKIVIFSNIKDLDMKIGLDRNSRKVVLMKVDSNHFDSIKYGKKNSKDYIIYSNPFIKFNDISPSAAKLNMDSIIKEDYSYYIFRKDVQVCNGKTIDDILLGAKIKSKLDVQRLGYYHIPNFPIKSVGWEITRNYRADVFLEKVEAKRVDIPAENVLVVENIPEAAVPVKIPEATVPVKIPTVKREKRIGKRRIDVVIVSVSYNDFLLVSLEKNSKIFENITVVTSSSDFLCQKICRKFGVKCVVTDTMYEDGAVFNKGKAINAGIDSISDPDYILLLDADVLVMNRIDLHSLDDEFLYTSDRYIVPDYDSYQKYISGDLDKDNAFVLNIDQGLGFFQLFNARIGYPESSYDASLCDIIFRDSFDKRKGIDNTILHLGKDSNWKGRKSKSFLDFEDFYSLLEKKSDFKICTFYYNPKKDLARKENFLKFLHQFEGYEEKMLIGIVDYGDDVLPILEKFENCVFTIKGDKNNPIWYKEILLNKMIDDIDERYIIWMDCDLIYDSLAWLEDIDSVVGDNDFVQLYEKIDYLDSNGEIIESHKSILSSGREDIDMLLGEGYKPGGSWIGKTSILKENKLFEKMYVGGGDTIFVYGLFNIRNGFTLRKVGEGSKEIQNDAIEWIENFGSYKFGYLSETISHLYHGDLKDRKYNDRYHKLKSDEVDVTILILAHKESEYLDKCINSAKDQKFDGNFEILLSSDSNEDLESIANNYGIRFTLAKKPYKNTSCSFNFNHGVKESSGKYIKYLSYDDWLSEDSIQDLYLKIKDSEYSLIYANSNDTFNNGKIQKYIPTIKENLSIDDQCVRNQIHGGTIMFRKDDFLQVGGLNENLIYAEEYDFYFNLLKMGKKIGYLDKFVYNYRRHNEQKGTLSLSDVERNNKMRLVESLKSKYRNDSIICGMATVEGREDSLKDTINSIINQVDKLIVYQNGYKERFDFLNNNKIEIISSLDTGIDMGDAGKFYRVGDFKDSYYLSIDDDLIYPEDYVQKIIHNLKKYNNKIIVSFHGRILDENLDTYYNGHSKVFRCLGEVEEDEFIHFGGTGVMGFHTSFVDIDFNYFKHPNMADIWVGLFARDRKIPILCISHDDKWILHTTKINLNETIFKRSKNNDSIQNLIISNFDRTDVIKYKKTIVFLTCTYERMEITNIFKKNIVSLQKKFGDDFNFINIVVDSDETNKEVFKNDNSFIYLQYGNSPLSHKWNYGSQFLKNIAFDNLIIIGSDDIIDDKLFDIYKSKIQKGVDFIGVKDLYMYDMISNRMFYWEGYDKESKRHGESIGMARCLSKKIVESLNYNLWGLELDKGLDRSMSERIDKYCGEYSKYIFNIKDNGISFDIKSKKNVTKLKDFTNLLEIKDFDIKKYL